MLITVSDETVAMTLARGSAMSAYAFMETKLARLISTMLETDERVGISLIHRVHSAHAKVWILRDIAEFRVPLEYSEFLEFFYKRLKSCESVRNEIARFVQSCNHYLNWGSDKFAVSASLVSHGLFSEAEHTIESVLAHCDRCAELGLVIDALVDRYELIRKRSDGAPAESHPMLDILRMPVPKTIPPDHPFYVTPSEWRPAA